MACSRRSLLAFAALGAACGALALTACADASSRLRTVRSPTGSGGVDLEVFNGTDVAINNLYLAKTETVNAAGPSHLEPGSSEEIKVWGADMLDNAALEPEGKVRVPVKEPGRWDVRVLDRDGRHQHIAGLKLGPGGKYVLELGEGGWRVR
jgi:hypothetical protein